MQLVAELKIPVTRGLDGILPVAEVVVALTSYPARIRHAWRAIETLLRQDVQPLTTVLVLSEDDFPRRAIPRSIELQRRRGLELVWVASNGHSFDKLIPARARYPTSSIVTVDDDLYFPAELIRELVAASVSHPGSIVGARGWRVLPSETDGQIHFGIDWERAQSGDHGLGLHMPGGNGCLYPPGSLDSVVDNLDLALSLAPTNDDIWFWIQAVRAGTKSVCLGLPPHRRITPQTKTVALSQKNRIGQETQFQNVLRHFGVDPKLLEWKID